jgi:two-component system, chemotaxis family, chemotaxis protein CheY
MGKRLLVVDDSRVSRIIIKNKIAALCPEWTIFEASTGNEAVEMAAQIEPDYITMDVTMPGINGYDAAEQLQKLLPTAKITMLTANIQESSRERAARLGVRFLPKPVTESVIEEAVDFFRSPV